MTRFVTACAALAAFVVVSVSGGIAQAQDSGLVGMLTSQLGVSEQQAAGGAGSLLDFAKGQMSAGDFDVVSGALPEADSLIGAAPEASSGTLGSASSLLGGSSSGLGDVAGVADAFNGLGMSPDMVNEFVPVILEYTESAGSDQAMQLLKSAFTAL